MRYRYLMVIRDLPNDRFFAIQLDYCAARNLPEGRFFVTQLDYCVAYSWPPIPSLIHSLIQTDITVNGWFRFEPLPISHVPIRLGGALIATCDTGRRHRSGLDCEPDVRQTHLID